MVRLAPSVCGAEGGTFVPGSPPRAESAAEGAALAAAGRTAALRVTGWRRVELPLRLELRRGLRFLPDH